MARASPKTLPIRVKGPQMRDNDQAVQENAKRIMRHNDYTIGWICALPIEMAAAKSMLDHSHETLARKDDDSNHYIFGDISKHNIVIACLPDGHYGTNNAATVANNMRRSFPAIDRGLVVGIGGGVPECGDVRLGDIVVGNEVVQYDFGKSLPNGFHRTGHPIRPPQILMTAVSKLRADHDIEPSKVPAILSQMCTRYPSMAKYTRPHASDKLFHRTYSHDHLANDCENCDQSELLSRLSRENSDPKVHYGRIASGNQVIKDGKTRAKLGKELGILCFEMEAAGLMDSFPCLIIRGICDYSDSHKNKEWQKYAAATAAAYAKELLLTMPMEMPSVVLGAVPSCSAESDPEQESQNRIAETREDLMASLIFDEINERYDTVRSAHARTCKWILEHPKYISWLAPNDHVDHHGFLWVKGKPGAGKTTLMKFCCQHIYLAQGQAADTVVVPFFFNARGVDLERSTKGMYQSLLLEIFKKFPDLQESLDQFKDLPRNQVSQMPWNIDKLESIFSGVIQGLGTRRLICFIDALDECSESQVQDMVAFFEELGEQAYRNEKYLRICFSSRHYPHIFIRNGIQLNLEDEEGHGKDIEKYIRGGLRAGKGKVIEDIVGKMIQKSAGVFMWVVLVVDILNKEFQRGRIFAVQTKLHKLPAELSLLFKTIVTRDNENMEDLLLCTQWILYASRPLKCQEFYFALVSGLDPSPENIGGWDPEMVHKEDMKLFVLSSSKGLAEITKLGDQTIQFIHESFSDFLVKHNGIRDLWSDHAENFESVGHDQLKICCDNYIKANVSEVLKLKQGFSGASALDASRLRSQLRRRFPFLEYAVHYVLHHANAAENGTPQKNYLKNFDLQSWLKLDNLFEANESRHQTLGASLMYILAKRDLRNLARSCILNGTNIHEVEKEHHGYPIFAALAEGHGEFLTVLFEEEECPGEETFKWLSYSEQCWTVMRMTPLHWAAVFGHFEIFRKILQSSTANIHSKDFNGHTPLHLAASHGRLDIVNLIVSNLDLKTNQQFESYLLTLAAMGGHEDVLRLLLTMEGANINWRDKHGRTALWWAAYCGKEATVNLLLVSQDIDSELGDNDGMTPLLPAAKHGYKHIVKVLTRARNTNTSITDRYGRTALSYAAERGHIDTVKLLLATDGVDGGLRDRKGRTPLLYAARNGHEAAVKLLLPLIGPDAGLEDRKGRTALYHANKNGHENIVKVLLRHMSGELSIGRVDRGRGKNGQPKTLLISCEHILED